MIKKILSFILILFLLVSCDNHENELKIELLDDIVLVENSTASDIYEYIKITYDNIELPSNEAIIDTTGVDFTKAGIYEANISYTYQKASANKDIIITIVSNTKEVIIKLTEDIIIEQGNTAFNFKEYLEITYDKEILPSEEAIVDISKVDFTKAGVYEIKVSYTYLEKEYTNTFSITITATPTKEVIIKLTEDITIEQGNTSFNFKEYLEITYDKEILPSEEAIVDISKVDFTKEGVYEIKISYTYLEKEYNETFTITITATPTKEVIIKLTEDITIEQGNTSFNFKEYLEITYDKEILPSEEAIVDISKVDFTKAGVYEIKISYTYLEKEYNETFTITIFEAPKDEKLVLSLELNNNTYGSETSGVAVGEYSENGVTLDTATAFKTEEACGAIRIGSANVGGGIFGYIQLPQAVNKIVINARAYTGSKDNSLIRLYIEDSEGTVLANKTATPTANYADYVFYLMNNDETRIYFEISNDDYERFYLNSVKFYQSNLNEISNSEKQLITEAFSKDYSNMLIKENFTGLWFYFMGDVIEINDVSFSHYIIKKGTTYYYYDEYEYEDVINSWEVEEYVPIFKFFKLDATNVYKEENGYTIYEKDLPGDFILYAATYENIEVLSISFTINQNGYIDSVKVFCLYKGKNYTGTFNFSNIGTTVIAYYPKMADFSSIVFADEEFTYDGNNHTPIITGLPDGATVSLSTSSVKDAGVYEVKATISLNGSTTTLTKKITINKATYNNDIITLLYDKYLYTGEEINLNIITTDEINYDIVVKKDAIETPLIETGTYEITIVIPESLNYLEKVFSFTVDILDEVNNNHPFISEYLEGSYHKDNFPNGNNNDKALELYNPTDEDISLSGYEIVIKSVSNEYHVLLEGTIRAHKTFVIVNKFAQESLKAKADMLGELYFSGIHVVALYYYNELVDIIGDFDEEYDTQTGITVNNIPLAATDGRLVRKPNTTSIGYFNESDWIVIQDQEFTDLGIHLFSFDDSDVDIKYVKFWLIVNYDYQEFTEVDLPDEIFGYLLEWVSYAPDIITSEGVILDSGEAWFGVDILDLNLEFHYQFLTIYIKEVA